MSPFIRAHGYLPGPTERPVAAGLVSGTLAAAPPLVVASVGGGLSQAAESIGSSTWIVAVVYGIFLACAGALYGWIFMRAANDRRGGWLFGISYGFVIWMLGPATIVQWTTGGPVAVGAAAQLFFAAHVIYGIILGVVFPSSHRLLRKGGNRLPKAAKAGLDLTSQV